jgi:hypothetical protein
MSAQTNISIPDRSLYAITAGLVAFACAMVSGNALLRDPDVLSHLAVGRWILDHRTVPAQDVFSHSMPGAPWVAHEWLTEILMAWLYGALGLAGLVAAAAFCFGLALALLAHALLRWLSPLHALIGVALAAAMCVPHLFARPHLVSYPFLVAWTAMLVLARSERRAPSLWWCLLIILWANLHASFLFGLVLAALFAAEAVFDATSWRAALRAAGTWLPFCLLSLLAGLATPYMLGGLTYPIHHAQLAFALSWIAEWQSPNMQELHPTGIWILLVLLAALFLGLRLPITRIAMLLVLVHMALKHQRHGELLGLLAPLLAAPALATQLRAGPALGPWLPRGALAFALAAAVTATLWAAPRIRLAPYYAPATALQSVDRAGLTGHVFNDYGFGGYLMFTGRQPFIDGRIDMYGDGLLRRFVDTSGLPALLDEYRIDWTLLRPTSPHLPLLDRLAGWQRLYADDIAVVHVRTGEVVGPGRR